MKKYVKPELFYERFELSQHIADCGWEMKNQSNEKECSAEPDLKFGSGALGNLAAETLFAGSNDKCSLGSNVYDWFCYHTGTSDDFPKVFSS